MYRAAGLDKNVGTLCLRESVARTVDLFAWDVITDGESASDILLFFLVLLGIIESKKMSPWLLKAPAAQFISLMNL